MSVIAEKRKKAGEVAAKLKDQINSYNERKKAQEKDPAVVLWPDNTRSDYDALNKEYDDLRTELKKLEDDDAMTKRFNEINEWENRSTQHGKQKPGMDDMNPATGREFGEDFEDLDEARNFAQRQADGRQFMRAFIVSHVNPDLVDSRMQEACQRLKVNPDRALVSGRLRSTEQFKRFQASVRNMNHRELDSRLEEETRSMTKAAVGAGSELVPITFINAIELAMLATSPFFAYCDVMRTETGEEMRFPLGDDTGNEGIQIDEEQDVNAAAQPDAALTQLTMRAFDFSSGFIKVSEQLNRDSIVSLDLLVGQMIGERLGRIKLRRATLGNGTTQPGGVVTQAAAGVNAAVAAAIAPDDTIRLQHSVDPMYRANGLYMAHDLVIQALRLLKDTTGRYIWQSGLKDGVPDTINGQGIIYNQYMASTIATTNITMLYGDFRYYKVREVSTIKLKKLNERFAERLQIGFMGFQSMDSRLQRWTAVGPCPVKRLTQP